MDNLLLFMTATTDLIWRNYETDTYENHLVTYLWYIGMATDNELFKSDPANSGYARQLSQLKDSRTVELEGSTKTYLIQTLC
jgi:hypothetical protein